MQPISRLSSSGLRSVRVLLVAQLVDAIGMGLLLPVLPFLAQELGASPVEITQIVALFALMSVLFSPLAGRMSDRVGRKAVVVGSCTLMCVSYAGLFWAPTLAAIFLFRALGGVAAAKTGVCNALILDVVGPAERGKYLGWLGAVNGLGMLIGPLLGALLGLATLPSVSPYRVVVGAGGAMAALTLGAVLLLPRDPREPRRVDAPARVSADERADGLRAVLGLLALNFGLFLGFAAIFSTSAIFVERRFGWDMTRAGLAIGLMTGTIAAVRAGVAHRLIERFGCQAMLRGSMLAFAVLLIGAGASTHPLAFLPAYCAAAASYAVAALAITVAVAERTDAAARGVAMGYVGSTSSAAIVLGAASFGYLFREVAAGAPFIVGGLANLASLALYGAWTRRRDERPSAELVEEAEHG
jgi:predicted MFS family arabinose efflux permease